jgi:cell division protein FtsB
LKTGANARKFAAPTELDFAARIAVCSTMRSAFSPPHRGVSVCGLLAGEMALMRPLSMLAAGLVLTLAPEASAQKAKPDDVKQAAAAPLRYRFTHVNDGVMRLDHLTGQVVFCRSQSPAKWSCTPVREESVVLQAQLNPAESDNSKLNEQLGELQKEFGMPEEERAALKAAIEKSQADSAAASSALGALREEIASLKQQFSSTQSDDALKAELARMRGSNEALAAELAAMRRDIANIGTQVTAQKQVESQRAEITRLQNENRQLNDQIAELRDETTAMQKRIAELEPPRPPAPVPAPKSSELKVPQMPSKEELAQARAAIAEAWRRVVEMLNDLKRDLTGKNDEDSVRL